MERRIIKVVIESDNEQDLKDAVQTVKDSLKDQPWRSAKTKTVKATSKTATKCSSCGTYFE